MKSEKVIQAAICIIAILILLGVLASGCRSKKTDVPHLELTASIGSHQLEQVKDSAQIGEIEHFIDSCESSQGKCASKDTLIAMWKTGFTLFDENRVTEDSAVCGRYDSLRYCLYGYQKVPEKGMIALRKDYKDDWDDIKETAVFMDGHMIHMYRQITWHDRSGFGGRIDSFTDYKYLSQLIKNK